MNQLEIIPSQIYIQKRLVELPQSDINLLWVDGNKNIENNYLTYYFQDLYNERFLRFTYQDEFLDHFRDLQKENSNHIVLTNGTEGRRIANEIKEQKILIFCGTKRYHIDFFMETPNIMYLVDSGVNGVKPLIQRYHSFVQNQSTLRELFNPVPTVAESYCHCSPNKNVAFYIMSEHCRNRKTSDQMVLKEIFLIEKYSNRNQLRKDDKFQSKENIFEKLVYAYTTNAIYDTLNRKFAQLDYMSVCHIMGCLYQGFSNLSENELVQETTIFRGVSFENRKVYDKILDGLKQGQKNGQIFYWQTLTSTSESLRVAKTFAKRNNNFGILFYIQLHDHPAYRLPCSLTEFQNELEVLLFPQFPFKVVNVIESQISIVSIEQVENQIEIQKLKGSRKGKYWQNYFNKVIIPAMDQTIESSFLRLIFIIENYKLFEEKLKLKIIKFLINELNRAFADIKLHLNNITLTVQNPEMKKAFVILFRSLKKYSLSSTPDAIKSQIFQLKSLIRDQSILLLKSQVFDPCDLQKKLRAINHSSSWDLSCRFSIFVAVKGAILDYLTKFMLDQTQVYRNYLGALLSATSRNQKLSTLTQEEITACQKFTDLTKNKFFEKINFQNCCDNQVVIPKLFYTHAAVLAALYSFLSQICEEKCFNSKNVISKFYALVIAALPYLEELVKNLTSGKIDLGNTSIYINVVIGVLFSLIQIGQIYQNSTLTEKQKKVKLLNELHKLLLQNGIFITCSVLGSSIFGSVGLILGQLVGQFISKFAIQKCQTEKPFKIKVQFSQNSGPHNSPIIQIKNIHKTMKNIIILAFKGDECERFCCLIVKNVKFNLIYIEEGANKTDKDFIYFDPKCMNEEKITFKAYGVADENIDKDMVEKMIKKKITLKVIDYSIYRHH